MKSARWLALRTGGNRRPGFGLALQKPAARESVTNIALDLGYESTSAFIAMFKRTMGTTPARCLAESLCDDGTR